jgi:MFS-type transporter involved in bile tolerance (Atg22 family)
LIYTVSYGSLDVVMLGQAQFILLAPGFLAMLAAVIYGVRAQRARPDQAVLPSIAVWKIPLLIVMTLSSLGALGVLGFFSFRRRLWLAGVFFIFAILTTLAMAGMASAAQTVEMQWVEEGINAAGQSSFALGCGLLYRNVKGRSC